MVGNDRNSRQLIPLRFASCSLSIGALFLGDKVTFTQVIGT